MNSVEGKNINTFIFADQEFLEVVEDWKIFEDNKSHTLANIYVKS